MSIVCARETQDVVRLYFGGRALVAAPIGAGLGLAVLEAMACVTPMVDVSQGGLLETIVYQETGLLVECSPRALGNGLQRALEDPALADRLGRAGRQHVVSYWNWTRVVDDLEARFAPVVGGLQVY